MDEVSLTLTLTLTLILTLTLTVTRIGWMDEVTAPVDVHTDRLIQQAVRNEGTRWTLITIAHRLGTVAGCDLIIGMARGQVAA